MRVLFVIPLWRAICFVRRLVQPWTPPHPSGNEPRPVSGAVPVICVTVDVVGNDQRVETDTVRCNHGLLYRKRYGNNENNLILKLIIKL